MPDVTETLRVELEEVGARHWWAALLATLSSQSGNAYMRFVGVVDGELRYFGRTFPVPRMWGPESPQEKWAPGMNDSLTDLTRRIDEDGWRRVGCGTRAWELTFERPSLRPQE
ncbi:hypothetical protein ACIBED_02315 [Rhodococcus coprophilus]|uniref:Uncharacterized protein n=1 Tax=Rhodococcus coprophilus TaxID=38310 RepID=A0A2X4U898_9NOCA|nr:hypothetical protein [Rhodococcus coprophilus]MBM7461158.1 hypothetical protein [Rhodococcus coprophilus]SQI28960.1 Uncharacterised protein [Rhodococcus coprophilus]